MNRRTFSSETATPPIEIAPAKNFAITTLAGINPKSLQNATFTWGIPLPAASRLTKVRIRPAKIDAAKIVARLKNAKAPGGICWDGFSQNIEKMMLTPFWKATAARPPDSP